MMLCHIAFNWQSWDILQQLCIPLILSQLCFWSVWVNMDTAQGEGPGGQDYGNMEMPRVGFSHFYLHA